MGKLQTTFEHPKTRDRHVAVWRDKSGTLHRAVGNEVHRGIRLLWTACGKRDVPANAAWLRTSEDEINCPDCAAVSECSNCSALVDGDGYSIDQRCCFYCKAD